MKKYLLAISSALTALMLAAPALAATVSLSPTSVNLTEGQSFNLAVSVDPQGAKSYTAKIEVRFPANLLQVTSFSFAGSWMPLSQAGYDLVDNTNGILIKTAGFPGGFSSPQAFGTVTFKSKAAGNAQIQIGSASAVYDAASQNSLSGSSKASVVIAAKTPAPQQTTPSTPKTTTPAPTPSQEETSATTTPETTEEIISQEEEPAQTPQENASTFAALGNILSLGTGRTSIAVIITLLIFAAIVYAVITIQKKRKIKDLPPQIKR